MLRHLRTIMLVLLPTALVALMPAVGRATPIGACDNPADSALNQYCETIPTAAGGQRPSAGTPALATALAPALARQIAAPAELRRAKAHRALLRLPAPIRRESLAPTGRTLASTSPLSTWIILILALLALALAGGAVAERRRRRDHFPARRRTGAQYPCSAEMTSLLLVPPKRWCIAAIFSSHAAPRPRSPTRWTR